MSEHPTLKPFNFKKWTEENADKLRPPVGNQLLHKEGDMIVMVVGGPNTRVDFHDDPVEEWFFQQKGDMMLKIADGGKIYDVPVREGEVFLLPPHVRRDAPAAKAVHAAQRLHAPSRTAEPFQTDGAVLRGVHAAGRGGGGAVRAGAEGARSDALQS